MRKFLEIAEKEIGIKEIRGGENPKILEYHDCTTLNACEDEVPWCSAFANWVVKQAGLRGTGSAAARSWLDWGVSIPAPKPGCIVILRRKDATNPQSAHVGFYVCDLPGGFIKVLGGNQGDQVKYSNFPTNQVLGYRDAKEAV